MSAKNNEKNSSSRSLFRMRIWEKNFTFARFGRKIKINQGLVGMVQRFLDPLYIFS